MIRQPVKFTVRHIGRSTLQEPEDIGMNAFPKPQRRDGEPPCGECRLALGEVCDICGAVEASK